MRKLIGCILIIAIFAALFANTAFADTYYAEFYVSTDGSDDNPGTADAPFKTIAAAKAAVRNVNKGMTGDIVVNIGEGYYYQDEMLDFRTEDSGFNGHRIIYRGAGTSRPVISGGQQITGFRESEYEGIYEADVEIKDNVILQLSVNGKRRFVAKGANQVTGAAKPESRNTEEWYAAHPGDDKESSANYYNPDTPWPYDGMYLSKQNFGFYENPEDILCIWNYEWTTNVMPVEKIEQDPDRADYLQVTMKPGLWNYSVSGNQNQAVHSNPRRAFTIMNAFELLDEPGEFYFNRKTKKLYYLPTEDEDMETAVVIAPRLDTVINLEGNDVTDKLTNITFENLQISDTRWDYMEGFIGSQATGIYGIGVSVMAPRAVFGQRCDGLEFKNNVFCNIGASALDMFNAVSNTKVIGNVFYDIGESAILFGAQNHGDYSLGSDGVSNNVPSEYKDAAVDLISDNVTKTYASFYMWDRKNTDRNGTFSALVYPGYGGPDDNDDKGHYDKIHVTWAKYNYSGAWRDSYSKTIGVKPYVAYEFLRPYTIDKISVSFDPKYVSADEKSDYEVLVSNDRSFAEGTYKVIATQSGVAPNNLNTYQVGDGNKYKYVMIRKLYPGDFAMSRVWVETKDRKPYIKNQRDSDIVIENNIAQRVGIDAARSIGLIVTHGNNFRIRHNEFKDIGYTGISIGYSWVLSRPTCYNMDVGYNYVYDTTQAAHDGGGIYVLGPQINSRYYNNHIERTNVGINGFYTDNGSRYETIENNYMEGVLNVLSPYTPPNAGNNNVGITENTFRNNYGTHGYSSDYAAGYNDWEPAIPTVIGQPSREAYDTYKNAGLEPAYEYLRGLIPEGRDNLYFKYNYLKNTTESDRGPSYYTTLYTRAKEVLSFTLKNGSFGDGLGMYPLEYKDKLSKIITKLDGYGSTDKYMVLAEANAFMEELKSGLHRYSLEKTIELCDLKYAEVNADADYPRNEVNAFATAVGSLKARAASIASPEEEYNILAELESAYNRLELSKTSASVEYVHVDGAERIEIDKDNRQILVYMPKGSSMQIDGIGMGVSDNSIIYKMLNQDFDISQPVRIPIYCKASGTYEVWTMRGQYTIESTKKTPEKYDWTFNAEEKDLIKYSADGATLPAGFYAYMAKSHGADEGTNIVFRPLTQHSINKLNFIVGAAFYDGFDYAGTDKRFDRCEVEFENDKAVLYQVSGGTRQQIGSAGQGVDWNRKNTIFYKVINDGSDSRLTINLNGRTLFDVKLSDCRYGNYSGFYSPHMNVKVCD